MTSRTPVSIRWIAAALFPALVLVPAAAVAADEPEKKREERRPVRREQRRPEQQQPQTRPAAPAQPERQAAPRSEPRTERRAAPSEAPRRAPETDRRPRLDQQPDARRAPSQVQPSLTPQERRPERSSPAAAPQDRRYERSSPSAAPQDRRPERSSPAAAPQDRRYERSSPAAGPQDRRPDRTPPPRNSQIIRHPSGDRIVTRSSTGSRTIVMERPDRTVVSRAPGRGYVQRPIVISNTTYVQRTYVQNNVVHTRAYRPYAHRGVTFAVYTPARYYAPPFYAWTYSPWRTPVRYTWGWYSDPWYGYYRGYFSPYPVYTSPALWLTDYLIASTLQAAYLDRMADRRAAANISYSSGGVPLSPEVKQAIAAEVQQQIQYERNEAQNQAGVIQTNGLPPGLADNRQHLFVVDRGFDVPNISMGGQICAISEGDVIQMDGPAPDDSDSANVVVVSSKPGSCVRGSTVSVYLADLSEMQNHLRQTVDQGMEELRSKQGQGGLPALPANLASAPAAASFASQLPPPDPNAASELQQQYSDLPPQDSPAAPQGPNSGVIPVYGGPVPAATISAGQSIEQVTAILGQPKSIADLGSKKVYVFGELKVTFIDGRVADVQ